MSTAEEAWFANEDFSHLGEAPTPSTGLQLIIVMLTVIVLFFGVLLLLVNNQRKVLLQEVQALKQQLQQQEVRPQPPIVKLSDKFA